MTVGEFLDLVHRIYNKHFPMPETLDEKCIVIEIGGGALQEVYNLPEGWTYLLYDHDNLETGEEKDEDGEVLADDVDVVEFAARNGVRIMQEKPIQGQI